MQSDKGGVGSLLKNEDDVIGASLNLFSEPGRELGMRRGREVVVRPVNLQYGGPYEFALTPQNSFFLPSATRLYGRARVIHQDGSALDENENEDVAIAPYMPGCFFSNIDIAMNQVHISRLSNELVHYKNYLEKTLSYGLDAHRTFLGAEAGTPDPATQFTVTDPNLNKPFRLRKAMISGSKVFEFFSDVPSDLFRTDRVFTPGLDIRITFNMNNEKTFIMTHVDQNYRLEIQDLKLYTHYVDLSDEITSMIMKKALNSRMYFPLQKTELKHYSIAVGTFNEAIPTLYRGILPHNILVAFTTSRAFAGDYDANAFELQHFNIAQADLKVNGVSTPSEPYTLDFRNNRTSRTYCSVFENIGVNRDNTGNILTKRMFDNGLFILAWDLTPDKCAGQHDHVAQEGNISLELSFGESLMEPCTMIAFGTYNALITIDNQTEIKCEYV